MGYVGYNEVPWHHILQHLTENKGSVAGPIAGKQTMHDKRIKKFPRKTEDRSTGEDQCHFCLSDITTYMLTNNITFFWLLNNEAVATRTLDSIMEINSPNY